VIVCFRLCSSKYRANSGAGAALHGGRWNPKGIEAIYTAATVSLAVLEVIVHFAVLPRDFAVAPIHIPVDIALEVVDAADLPSGWDGCQPSSATQDFGRRWASERRSAVLSVPSAIVASERNYVLNPRHRDFDRIRFLPQAPYRFDPRLK
jgi:RES domain-containing protein